MKEWIRMHLAVFILSVLLVISVGLLVNKHCKLRETEMFLAGRDRFNGRLIDENEKLVKDNATFEKADAGNKSIIASLEYQVEWANQHH